jgi:hypothetical protein
VLAGNEIIMNKNIYSSMGFAMWKIENLCIEFSLTPSKNRHILKKTDP